MFSRGQGLFLADNQFSQTTGITKFDLEGARFVFKMIHILNWGTNKINKSFYTIDDELFQVRGKQRKNYKILYFQERVRTFFAANHSS